MARLWDRTKRLRQRWQPLVVFLCLGTMMLFVNLMQKLQASFLLTETAHNASDMFRVMDKVDNGQEYYEANVEGNATLEMRKNVSLASDRGKALEENFIQKTSEELFKPRKDKVNRLEVDMVDNGHEYYKANVEGNATLQMRKNGSLASDRGKAFEENFIPNTSEEYFKPQKDKVNRLEVDMVDNGHEYYKANVEGNATLQMRKNGSLASDRGKAFEENLIPKTPEELFKPQKDKVNRLEVDMVDNGHEYYKANVEGNATLQMRKNGSLASDRGKAFEENFIPNTSEEYFKPLKDKVNRLDTRFLIANKGFCEESAPYLLIVVLSVSTHTSKRMAIRNTYGSYRAPWCFPVKPCFGCPNNGSRETTIVGKSVKVLFFFGRGVNASTDQLLGEENIRHGDIVQADFHDSYKNLTLKMMVVLKWVTSFCDKVDYLLKIDEDVFVNIPLLISQLHSLPYTDKGLVVGNMNYNATVKRHGKWNVRTDQYPLSTYPTYASGNSYVISCNIIPRMFTVSEYMPYMPIEDVFVTGILAKIVGSEHIFLRSFTRYVDKSPKPSDFFRQNRTTANKVKSRLMFKLWKAQTAFKQKCQPKL